MSASKLIIQKIEAGVNLKYINVSIEDENNYCPKIKYTEWKDDRGQGDKKDSDKPSRLVVKIVSGNELDKFNLDISAKELDDSDLYLLNSSNASCGQKQPLSDYYKLGDYDKYDDENREKDFINEPIQFENNTNYAKQLFVDKNYSNKEKYLSPLEHSLEKVKENNARIMENIHMLNRTLNYTKKKEILDIVCPKSMQSHPCDTCGKCFVYETGLRRHYSIRHAITETQPRWQVVWTCIQCFQVWPHRNQALKHSSTCCKLNDVDCIREIKTSSLLQCEFCEKVYTSIPRLLRHSKLHTTTNNYECNACGIAFTSYKTAEQHWVMCPWLKMNYNFSLPKLLLCNVCDRKFRNYEQLYNHRYKVGHFLTKTHRSESTIQSVSTLVYQCEVCGESYTTIALLKFHKNQHHPRHEIGMQFTVEKNCKERPNCYVPAENEYYVNQIEDTHN